jgi:hypothetical protein
MARQAAHLPSHIVPLFPHETLYVGIDVGLLENKFVVLISSMIQLVSSILYIHRWQSSQQNNCQLIDVLGSSASRPENGTPGFGTLGYTCPHERHRASLRLVLVERIWRPRT